MADLPFTELRSLAHVLHTGASHKRDPRAKRVVKWSAAENPSSERRSIRWSNRILNGMLTSLNNNGSQVHCGKSL